MEALDLKQRIKELEAQLLAEQQSNMEKTAMMQKTIADTEDIAKHLQNTTLALIQERQTAFARAEKEKLLHKWIEKIHSTLDIDELLSSTANEIGSYLKADRCGIALFDHQIGNQCISIVREYCHSKWTRTLDPESLRHSYYIRKTHKIKKTLAINQLEHRDQFSDSVQSLLMLPIIVNKECAGILYLQQCNKARAWNEREIDLIESSAFPLSTALEKARLYKEAKQRTDHAELLNSLTTQIRSSLNLGEILARTVNELGRALHASRCFLYFDGYISEEYCKKGTQSISKISKNFILDKLVSIQSFDTITISRVLSEENLSKLNQEERNELIKSKAKSILATPLHFQGILQGWIIFHDCEKERYWTKEEKSFVEAAGSQVIVAMTQSRMYEKLTSYQENLSRELKQAARVQTSLIGGDVFDVLLEASVFYKAHSNVSGDFYWVAELAPDTVGVLIGDVSGKGPAAALLTGYLLGEFNAAVANSALAWYPDKLISFLCQSILYQNASSDFYATAWYGVFDLSNGLLKYTNAGHLNPYLIKNGAVTQLDEDKSIGVPLGLIDPRDIEESYGYRTIELDPGDKMLLLTDGVLDQKMPGGDFVPKNWVAKALQELKYKSVKEITYELNEKLNELSGATSLSDDRLMICLEQTRFSLEEFPAVNPGKCAELILKICSECLEHNMPRARIIDLKLGLTEALSNAVRYGLKKNPYGQVKLGYKVSPGSFKMSIIDPGPGFNWQVYSYTDIDEVRFEEEGGRGIPLLREIFDKVTWNYLGNHVGLFMYW
jgi:GAF domain-containing protein/anti-sigma regulatory factor (Ser/Thr protein kinase)